MSYRLPLISLNFMKCAGCALRSFLQFITQFHSIPLHELIEMRMNEAIHCAGRLNSFHSRPLRPFIHSSFSISSHVPCFIHSSFHEELMLKIHPLLLHFHSVAFTSLILRFVNSTFIPLTANPALSFTYSSFNHVLL